MRLDDLVPYAKNPRDNDKAVDGVAASIREFGFRGAIVCDREHERRLEKDVLRNMGY